MAKGDELEGEIKKFNSIMKKVDIIEEATQREVREAYDLALKEVVKDDTDQLADETKRAAFAKKMSAEIAKAARKSLKLQEPEKGKEDVIEDAKLMKTHTNLTYDTIKGDLDRSGKNTNFERFYQEFADDYRRQVLSTMHGTAGQHISGKKEHIAAIVDMIDEKHVIDPKYVRKQELMSMLEEKRKGAIFTDEFIKGRSYAKKEYRVPEDK